MLKLVIMGLIGNVYFFVGIDKMGGNDHGFMGVYDF